MRDAGHRVLPAAVSGRRSASRSLPHRPRCCRTSWSPARVRRPGATFLEDATVIFEVLSPGTQRRDREEKWFAYQRLPSLRHYVLVSRDTPSVQRIDRENGSWSGFRIIEGLEAELALPSLALALPLAEIYADVIG